MGVLGDLLTEVGAVFDTLLERRGVRIVGDDAQSEEQIATWISDVNERVRRYAEEQLRIDNQQN